MGSSKTLSADDRTKLTALYNALLVSAKIGAWNKYVTFFTEDAITVLPDGRVLRGRASIAAYAQSGGPVLDGLMSQVHHVEVRGTDHLAWQHADFELRDPDASPESPSSYRAMRLTVYERQDGGRWLVAADMWNLRPGDIDDVP